MSLEAFKMLDQEVTRREWKEGQEFLTMLSNLYEGQLPDSYKKHFPKNSLVHIINTIRLAWDDLATTIGRLPAFRGDPGNDSDIEMKRVGKVENVASWYIDESEPSGKLLMWILAFWLLAGQSVALVVPNPKKKIPTLTIRDPRTAYPGIKRSIGNQIVELSDIIFKYEVPAQEMLRRGLKVGALEPDRMGNVSRPTADMKGTIIEYIDDKRWIVISDGGTAQVVEHNLGRVPAYVFRTFSPNNAWGASQFKDQITFMVAMSQLVSQKIALGDRLIYPVFWVRGHEGAVRIGPHVINKLGPNGEMGQLAPPATFQVDKDLEMLERWSRIMNRNPEVRQGEVQSKGAYIGARTLEQLAESLDTTMGRHWDVMSVGLEYLTSVMLEMDEKLWPNVEKSISMKKKNRTIRDKYTPKKDINGRYRLHVEYGFVLDGYQGFLQSLQAMDAGVMTRKQVIENIPGGQDVDAVVQGIDIERMDASGMMMMENLSASGQMDMILWAKFRKEMAEKGTPMHEVILKYQTEIQAQANQAVQAGGAEALTAAEAPTGEAPVEPGTPPGLPPSAMMGV